VLKGTREKRKKKEGRRKGKEISSFSKDILWSIQKGKGKGLRGRKGVVKKKQVGV